MAQHPIPHRFLSIVGVVVLAGASAAVTGHAAADKTGSDTLVLHFATIDGDTDFGGPGARAFLDKVGELSDGEIQVEVATDYGNGAPDAESQLIQAIASGEVDGGWPSTRAFANAGFVGLQAVEAPLMITSYDAERAFVGGAAGDLALRQLEGSGVHGLGLMVGPLRRPIAADTPLLEPDDWAGATFRVYHSPVQAAAVQALGGDPVDLSFSWHDEFNAGSLDGAEISIDGYQPDPNAVAAYLTSNVVLWPKVMVLSLSAARYDDLSDEQREWITAAASDATVASVDEDYDDSAAVPELCAAGLGFAAATDEQLTAMRDAVAPVIDELAADPVEAPLLAEVRTIAADHPTADAVDVPADCAGMLAAPSSVPDTASDLPDGTYRVAIEEADLDALGLRNDEGYTGTWTLLVDDATYQITCRPLDNPAVDCGHSDGYTGALEAGELRGVQDRVWFVGDSGMLHDLTGCQLPPSYNPGHCGVVPPYSVTWAVNGDQLILSEPSSPAAAGWPINPWQRID